MAMNAATLETLSSIESVMPDQLSTLINDAIEHHYGRNIGKRRDDLLRNGRSRIADIIARMDIDGIRDELGVSEE